jgi:glycosyltransferase involved in cell wall biosynthesis
MMKILFLPSVMTEANFGGLTHQVELVSNLSKKTELYLIPKEGGEAFLAKNGNELPISRENDLRNYLDHVYKTLRWGIKSARKTKFDVIYARHGISTIPALIIGKLARIPIIIEVNGILADEFKVSNNNRPINLALDLLDTVAFTRPTRIVVVTDELKEYISKRYKTPGKNIDVILNGVNTEIFRPIEKTTAREKLSLDTKQKYICFVGSLAPWQGVEYLIEAIPKIKTKCPEIHIIIVGDGPKRVELEQITKKMALEPCHTKMCQITSERVMCASYLKSH